MAASYPLRPGEADCRDYLRTGRCKYGESCKYNHPHNVESGGGVRPSNPSEPLFPIRPMEPLCQYFLKHGTCKFGQSCKFNHPSGAPLSDGSSGLPAGQLVFVTSNAAPGAMPGDSSSHLMTSSASVQVLPQRPAEPNCIYFLRNGKCKYGATCKFHHPLDAINRNREQQVLTSNMRASQNMRDRSSSVGSISDGRSQIQHNGVNYTTAANVSYMQPQRLQPITERVRPQQPTHILLPDGQIAVILDPQSLQNVSELNTQDRPKFYLSQTDGSIGTLPSMDQNNNPVVISPMLTATTNSTSNHTFDSSIDLGAYQGQALGTQSRGPHKSGSGGSLSAYGSVDSGSHAQGEFSQQVSGQVHSQQMSPNQGQASFPQYSAWPMNEGIDQSNQAQMRRSPPSNAGQRHAATSSLERTVENTASYFWPSNGSFSSIPVTERDAQAGRSYASVPNSSPYGSSNAVGQPIHRSYSAGRNAPIPTSVSSEQTGSRHAGQQQSQEQAGDDCEGLTMMTSALLTMMDHHEGPSNESDPNASRISTPPSESHNMNQKGDVYFSQSEPDLQERSSPMRPPPGMVYPTPTGLSNINSGYSSSNFNQDLTSYISQPEPGGGYFLGGYDQAPPSMG